MKEWIAQLGLLAQDDDFTGWANILFIVIIMVFSAVGGLLKNSGARKKQQQTGGGPRRSPGTQPRETWQQRLIRKAEQMQRAAEARHEETPRPRPTPSATRPRSPEPGRLVARQDRSGKSILVYEKDRPEMIAQQQAASQRQAREATVAARRAAAQRRLAVRRQRQPDMTIAPLPSPQPLPIAAKMPHQPAVATASPPVINYDDPDALKKAILHYEILGKPLALRDPFERTSGY